MLRFVVGVALLLAACTHPNPPEPEKQDETRVEPPKLVPIHPIDHLELSGTDASLPSTSATERWPTTSAPSS